jgi:hypothetical protein
MTGHVAISTSTVGYDAPRKAYVTLEDIVAAGDRAAYRRRRRIVFVLVILALCAA